MERLADILISEGIVPPGHPWRILDTRSESQFKLLHLIGAVSLPLRGHDYSVETLETSLPSILLPARHEPLLIVVESAQHGEAVINFLSGRGRSQVLFYKEIYVTRLVSPKASGPLS